MKNLKALFVLMVFTFTSTMPPQGWAQALVAKPNAFLITAVGLMPKPGRAVSLSASFDLAHFKGMVINPSDPFKFDFIIHQGDEKLSTAQKQQEYTKLIKYFLAALAVPDTDQWVNLSPYEKDRIVADDFGKTAMGRDLLAQDYLLKQLSSSLTNPETNLGQQFWNQVYARVYQQFGTRNVPLNTFNKVWIVPDKAVIYEKGNMVYVISSHLKVMTEADYLAMKKHHQIQTSDEKSGAANISNQVMRQVILPSIEKEVNEGKNFAPLRQVFSSMILATWYKHALKESILGRLYANKGKIKGIEQDPRNDENIYQDYLKAYKKGVYNMIKEDADPVTQEVIPRKYFSGGAYNNYNQAMVTGVESDAQEDYVKQSSAMVTVTTRLARYVMPLVLGLTAGALVNHPTDAKAQTNLPAVVIGWNPSTDPSVVGYKLYYGSSHENYTNVIVLGNVTNAVINNLNAGTTYYIAGTTYQASGVESAYSSEVTYSVPIPNPINTYPGPNQVYLSELAGSTNTVIATSDNPNITGFSFNPATDILSYTVVPGATSGTATIAIDVNGLLFEDISVSFNQNPTFTIGQLTDTMTNGNNSVSFPVTADSTNGFTLNVQASPDLQSWTNIGTLTIPAGLPIGNFYSPTPDPSPTENYRIQFDPTNDIPSALNENPRDVDFRKKIISADAAMSRFDKGGIDFAASNLDMQIKRDGKGLVLPISQQNLDNIHIDGLVPVILDIKPVENTILFNQDGENLN